MSNKHIHNFRVGRGSVDVCDCGKFRHNEKAGPAITEMPSQQATQDLKERARNLYASDKIQIDSNAQMEDNKP